MPYVPIISNYKPFYFQTEYDDTAWDTRDYGMVAQTQPFPDNYEVKDPYKNDWLDENGDDEYTDAMYRKAFELTVKFYIKTVATSNDTPVAQLNELRTNFRAKITTGEFKIWDSWQERGFSGVRFVKDEVEQRDVNDNYAWMIFSVTLKVNDPSTAVTFSDNVIS